MHIEMPEWVALKDRFSLTDDQVISFKRYADLLQEWNEKINLTAIDTLGDIVETHFQDSLEISRFIDFSHINMIADVGTGGGFPGLPLKILFPHIRVVLIEVNHKKIQFLQCVIEKLNLDNVELIDLDWRTFLRHTALPVDLFLARASLQPVELLRIYKPKSPYMHAVMVYWASQYWQPDDTVAPYVTKKEWYKVGDKRRQYIFLSKPL